MESRKEGSRPQVRQTALPQYSRTRRRVSPSWGGAFLLRKLTRERRPDKVEKGCSSAPTPSPFPELCGEITAAAGRGGPAPRRVPGQDDPGISGLRDQRGLAGRLTSLGLFLVSSSLAARFPAPRLLLRPPPCSSPPPPPPPAPDAAAPSSSIFLWPCHLPPRNPKSPQGQTPLGALRMSRVHGQRGLPAKRRSQATGSPQAQATPTQTTPVPPLSAGASPAPKQLQSPRSPPPSGRRLGWRKSRCLSL